MDLFALSGSRVSVANERIPKRKNLLQKAPRSLRSLVVRTWFIAYLREDRNALLSKEESGICARVAELGQKWRA